MLRKLRLGRPSHATVVAYLALFVALGGTSAYAANTVFSSDIVDGEVKSVDIANNSIHSGDVLDNTINTFDVHSFLGVDVVDNTLTGDDIRFGSLTTNDIGTRISLSVGLPALAANNCINVPTDLAGATPQDHVVVTPSTDAHPALVYEARAGDGEILIHICNFANATISDGTTHFNIVDLDVVDD